jgi:hypothetical protein
MAEAEPEAESEAIPLVDAIYRPSGRDGNGIIACPIGMLVALLLSVVYGYVCVYNPVAGFISVLIPFAYALVF